jgi:hypothetical protein
MRISGGFLVAAVLAAGFALFLTGRDARTTFDAVDTAADGLREEGVQGRTVDTEKAARMVAFLDDLLEFPDSIEENLGDLRVVTEAAASWAAAAPSASRELHMAVNLRSAAGELRAYGLSPSPRHLTRARRYLEQAQSSLESTMTGVAEPQPSQVTDGLRDQLQNLEQAQREQRQQIDESLKR